MNEHPSNFAHLKSDVKLWKHPDRNYMTFVIVSFVLGFFGVDHIYLRSFQTAFAKTVVNLFTFGLWYIWDILQILYDGERIKKEGLNSPFDWIKGIGRGVFASPESKFQAPKDYIFYTFLTFFGFLGADKFYIGEYGQGIVKLISCFNIFLFLFGWFWVLWDWYNAISTSAIIEKIYTPLPYSFIFPPIDVQPLFKVQDPREPDAPTKQVSWLDWFYRLFPSLPALPSFLSIFAPFSFLFGKELLDEIYQKLIVPIFGIGESVATLATQMEKDGTQILAGATNQLHEAQAAPSMTGGARPASQEGSGLGPVLAGSIAALLLAGGAKGFYDFIRKQL